MDVKIVDRERMEFNFKDIPRGSVFQTNGIFFIRAVWGDIWAEGIPATTAIRTGDIARANAIRIEDGTLYCFPAGHKVYAPTKAVLNVEW